MKPEHAGTPKMHAGAEAARDTGPHFDSLTNRSGGEPAPRLFG